MKLCCRSTVMNLNRKRNWTITNFVKFTVIVVSTFECQAEMVTNKEVKIDSSFSFDNNNNGSHYSNYDDNGTT